jgi:hypothetical protein
MNRTILYYPTIDIPNKSWLRHALLYYDEISSIVPQSWDDRFLIELSSDIHYLMDENQFRPMKPEDLIFNERNGDTFDQFREEFTSIILDPNYREFIGRRPVGNFSIHKNKIELNLTASIHKNKTTDSIFDLLQEQGLASQNDNDEWLMFEEKTAMLYMSLLAKYLADIDGDQTSIGTDLAYYEKLNFKRVNEDVGFPVVSLNLNKVLPSPRANVPLEKIIDFKRRRGDNLRHFKRMLSEFQVRIANTESQAEFKETAINFKETLINGVNDLTAAISDSRIETAYKSFKSLIGVKSPTTWLTAGAALNARYNLANIPLNWEAFSIGAMGAVEIAGCYIEARNRERARLRESPFSYLYFANRYGVINKP